MVVLKYRFGGVNNPLAKDAVFKFQQSFPPILPKFRPAPVKIGHLVGHRRWYGASQWGVVVGWRFFFEDGFPKAKLKCEWIIQECSKKNVFGMKPDR